MILYCFIFVSLQTEDSASEPLDLGFPEDDDDQQTPDGKNSLLVWNSSNTVSPQQLQQENNCGHQPVLTDPHWNCLHK